MKYPEKCAYCTQVFDSMDSVADTKADVRRHVEKEHPGKEIPEVWWAVDSLSNKVELIRKPNKKGWCIMISGAVVAVVDLDRLDLLGLGMAIINECKGK